jgi:hypothetical protein
VAAFAALVAAFEIAAAAAVSDARVASLLAAGAVAVFESADKDTGVNVNGGTVGTAAGNCSGLAGKDAVVLELAVLSVSGPNLKPPFV